MFKRSVNASLAETDAPSAVASTSTGTRELAEIEETLTRASDSMFLLVGRQLEIINNKKLYLMHGFNTLRQYLISREAKFGFGYKTGERCLLAAQLTMELSSDRPRPSRVSHILPLASIENAANRQECWDRIVAVAGGAAGVSIRHVENILIQHVGHTNARVAVRSARGLHLLRPSTQEDANSSWFTPIEIIERVRLVFGGAIDLDPCTEVNAQCTIQAKQYYTVETDGLDKANIWSGNVYVNPPYGHYTHNKGMQELFLDRVMIEYGSGNIRSCIMLLKCCVGSRWFQKVLTLPHAWLNDRLSFSSNHSESGKAPFGSVLVYVGPNTLEFAKAFQDIASIPGCNTWGMVGNAGDGVATTEGS